MDWDEIALRKPVAFDKPADDSEDSFEEIQSNQSPVVYTIDKEPESMAAVNEARMEDQDFDEIRDLEKETHFLSSIFNKIFDDELIEKLLREL